MRLCIVGSYKKVIIYEFELGFQGMVDNYKNVLQVYFKSDAIDLNEIYNFNIYRRFELVLILI